MFRTLLIGTVTAVLVSGMSIATVAQETTATQDAKKAGTETKDAAKDAGKATGKAAKKTGQVTKDAAKETAAGTTKAAKTVKKKLTPDTTSAACKDGTVQTGKTKTTACFDHGGVRD